ncbi:hypothetical protein COOONC_05692 [Cooperia oncophora]
MEIFCYVFLPPVARWIFITLAVLLLLVFLAGCKTMKLSLIRLFVISNLFMKIPVFIVTYYIIFTLKSYDQPTHFPPDSCYQCWLYRQPVGLLSAAFIMTFACPVFDGISTACLTKLELLAQGVTTVVIAERDCHHPHPVVVTTPQHVVYTTPASTQVVYPSTAVYQAPGYPVAQPYAYQQAPQPQASAPVPAVPQAPPEYKP